MAQSKSRLSQKTRTRCSAKGDLVVVGTERLVQSLEVAWIDRFFGIIGHLQSSCFMQKCVVLTKFKIMMTSGISDALHSKTQIAPSHLISLISANSWPRISQSQRSCQMGCALLASFASCFSSPLCASSFS